MQEPLLSTTLGARGQTFEAGGGERDDFDDDVGGGGGMGFLMGGGGGGRSRGRHRSGGAPGDDSDSGDGAGLSFLGRMLVGRPASARRKTRRVCEKDGVANVKYKNISEKRRRYVVDIYTTLVDSR